MNSLPPSTANGNRTGVQRGRQSGALLGLVLLPLFVYAVVNWTLMVHEITRLYINLPMWDYFNEVEHYPYFRDFRLAIFWQQHNEHRIVFPEIVFALDMLLFQGRQVFTLVVSLCAYFGIWLVMAGTVLQDKSVPALNRYCAIVIGAIVAGWKGGAAALAIPFLLQWPFVQISTVLALLFLSLVKQRGRPQYLALTIVSGVVATYSSGNGILIWPLVLAGGLLLRLSGRQIAAIALSGSLAVGLYFIDYKRVSNVNIHDLVAHPFYLVEFIASYLAMPFSALGAPRFGVRLGVASLIVLFVLVVLAVRARLFTSTPGVVLFGYCAFAILSALITATGRMNPSDPLIQAAKASRYLTVPLIYWSALAMAAVWIAGRRFGSLYSLAVAVALSLCLLKMFPKLGIWYHGQENAFADQQWAAICVESGIMDRTANGIVFVDPGYVVRFNPILQRNRLALFSEAEADWIGRPVQAVFSKISSTVADGDVALIFPIDSGVAVAGWAGKRFEKNELVFVDQNNRIVGLGKRPGAGLPSRFSTHNVPPLSWVGFVNLAFQSKSFAAYLVDGQTLVPIGKTTKIPAMQSAARADMGPGLAGIDWAKGNGWSTGLIPPGADAGDAPPGAFLSSWNGNDASTGFLTSSTFAPPANGCVVWPVLHGPSVDGLRAQIVDAKTGQIVAEAPLRDQDTKWNYWRLSLTAGGPNPAAELKIVARDEGVKWGQWLAISAPSQCR